MADRTPLIRRPGTWSSRVAPVGWIAPEGSHAFVLGSDEPGLTGFFFPGDRVRVEQTGSYGLAKLIRASCRVRGTESPLPTGWKWQVFCVMSGVEVWTFDVVPGRTFDVLDAAASTQIFGGSTALSFGLRAAGPGTVAVELEIPAFYVDQVILDVATTRTIANRVPAPGAEQVALTSPIRFSVLDSVGTPGAAAVIITVDGLVVFSGGVASPGWTVSVTTPYVGAAHFVVTPPAPWSSEQVVTARVEYLVGGVVETWSFVAEDLTAPRVVAAESPSHDTIRVTFDEPIVASDPTSSADALNPANYTVTRLEAPAVAVVPVSVRSVGPATVEIVLDVPITRRAAYSVAVTDVEDIYGNVVAPPFNVATVIGYECPVPASRRFELWRMIPQKNRDEDASRDLFKFMSLVQEPVDLLLCDVDRWTEILDVDAAPERYLDLMLAGLGNPFSFDLTEVDKRRLIRVLPTIYALKGTARGIIDVVRFFLGLDVTIDAYNGSGSWILGVSDLGDDTILAPSLSRELYSFDVVSGIALTDEQRRRIREIAVYMKPAHTHLIQIREPVIPEIIDHVELGLSELDTQWDLHL